MLRPGLTFDTAVKEVGFVVERNQWVISYTSELVRLFLTYSWYRRRGSCVEDFGFANAALGGVADVFREELMANHVFESSARPDLMKNLFAVKERVVMIIKKTVFEMIMNAIEHGGGAYGDCVITTVRGDGGMAFAVEQPGKGPDIEGVYASLVSGKRPEDFVKRGADGTVIGGFGMMNMVDLPYPQFWYEKLPNGGTRAVVLETAERLRTVVSAQS